MAFIPRIPRLGFDEVYLGNFRKYGIPPGKPRY